MFSIIVPTLNEEKGLEGTLRGLRALSCVPYELIVADSGSRDATRAIAARYADRVVAYQGGPQSAARGRNLGASVARGDILVFIDADMRVPQINEAFAALRALFLREPTLVSVIPRIEVEPARQRRGDRMSYLVVNSIYWTMNNWLRLSASAGAFQAVRAGPFRAIGGYDEGLVVQEDNDMLARLSAWGETRVVWWLRVFHNPRRERAVGWGRVWYGWISNGAAMRLIGRPLRNEWEEVR